MSYIKRITSINVMHHHDGTKKVYIKHPDMQEMVAADALEDLDDFIEMMFAERQNPALKDCLDRARMLYQLSKRHER